MPPALQPVLLEVLAHIPTDFFHCSHCEQLFGAAGIGAPVHQEVTSSYPQEMLDEAGRLLAWLENLSARYGERLHVRVIDPQSLEGFLKSARYWTRRYPAFIIDRRTKLAVWEPVALDRALREHMAQRGPDQGQETATVRERVRERARNALRVLGEVFYGMTTFDWVRDVRRERGEVERLFVLITFGDLVGLPILPPYYTLRLLPFIIPSINRWRRSILRERDWTDLTGLIEGID
jgi:hypothetical protein